MPPPRSRSRPSSRSGQRQQYAQADETLALAVSTAGHAIGGFFTAVAAISRDRREMWLIYLAILLAALPAQNVLLNPLAGPAPVLPSSPDHPVGGWAILVCLLIPVVAYVRFMPVLRARGGLRRQSLDVAIAVFATPSDHPPKLLITWERLTAQPTTVIIALPPTFTEARTEDFIARFNKRVPYPNPPKLADGEPQLVWAYDWDWAHNRVQVTVTPGLPTFFRWPGVNAASHMDWQIIPLAKTIDGEDISIDLISSPHMLFTGSTGTGKSVAVNVVIATALSRGWDVWAADPKETEFFYLQNRPGIRVAVDNEPCWQLLVAALEEMRRRKSMLSRVGARAWYDGPARDLGLQPMIVVVDEAFDLLAARPENDEQKEAQKACAAAIESIARLGRSAGVHLLLAAQRPDAKVIKGELRSNLRARLLLGAPLSSEVLMMFDGGLAQSSQRSDQDQKAYKGRGWFWQTGLVYPAPVQVAYATDEDLEEIADAAAPRAGAARAPATQTDAPDPDAGELEDLGEDVDDEPAAVPEQGPAVIVAQEHTPDAAASRAIDQLRSFAQAREEAPAASASSLVDQLRQNGERPPPTPALRPAAQAPPKDEQLTPPPRRSLRPVAEPADDFEPDAAELVQPRLPLPDATPASPTASTPVPEPEPELELELEPAPVEAEELVEPPVDAGSKARDEPPAQPPRRRTRRAQFTFDDPRSGSS